MEDKTSPSLLFVGDVVPNERTVCLFKEKNIQDLFDSNLISLIRNVDYSIANYEAPIVLGYQHPIVKTGPHLHSFPEVLVSLKDIGFKMITLANNHFRDYGQQGVEETLDYADKISIEYVGGGKNYAEARQIKYHKIKGRKFAFINVCEHEWSIATNLYGGSNPYDLINIYHDISASKKNADFVIMIIHGGIEH